MLVEIIGKFYDNHSLSVVNRNIVSLLKNLCDVRIIALDKYDPKYKVAKETIKELRELEKAHASGIPDVQLRHTYPPIWQWPEHASTKVVYIQPWEFTKVPFEWQYKFETFADALIVPSNYTHKAFAQAGIKPSNIFIVPNGYNPAVFNNIEGNSVENLGIDRNNFNFVYVGNAQWRKGLDILLNAWSRVFRKSDKARLIIKDNPNIYGESSILQEIVKLQFRNNCAEIIYIPDDLSEMQMADLYKASKVIVHPYRAEGFGMHVQEAVACGCIPIISSNGPTDDFIPNGVGSKIDTRLVGVNPAEPSLFAMKPGDALSNMGSHMFMQEPVQEHLELLMHNLYHTHDKTDIINSVKNINTLNTWQNVVKTLHEVLVEVNGRAVNRR